MAILSISRKKEFKSSIRQIKIECNGREIGSIGNGETKDFQLPHGNNYIKATLDGICTSNPVELTAVGDETFKYRLYHRPGIALINMIFNSKNYMILERI